MNTLVYNNDEARKEHIQYFKEEYGINLKKGFYWQSDPDNDMILVEPKDHWKDEECLFDQHTSAEIFLDDGDYEKFGEAAEGMYEFEGSKKEFKQMIEKYKPFFEYKKMF